MKQFEKVQLFELSIKQELSKLIPKGSEGSLLREIIFSHCTIESWFTISLLIIKYCPELKAKIEQIIEELGM